MPQKNSIKQYLENGYYHIYNRGVEKRSIFLSDLDYNVFLTYLKEYLLPKDKDALINKLADPQLQWSEKETVLKLLKLKNFFGEVSLLAYCLMPNHFHLLIKQNSADSLNRFMQSLSIRYTMYFNNHYSRVGSLFQGVYKAVLVDTDEQLLHLSRYIHKQALKGETLQYMQPCSYPEYQQKRKSEWVYQNEVLSFFSKYNPALSYKAFMEQQFHSPIIAPLLIDDE